ncbi:MAG: hypothetical protein LC674_00930, partial [Actinobacteria bacterium]|nr:hypothetical protein [Actinomycetota bacterium]
SALYQHELARVHANMEDAIFRLGESRRRGAFDFRERFKETLQYSIGDSGEAERTLRERWADVARTYHLLNAVLLKHGFKRTKPPTQRPESTKPSTRPKKPSKEQ